MKSSELDSLLFTVYFEAVSSCFPKLPCVPAILTLIRFSGLFAFTQFFFKLFILDNHDIL